jgi:Tol biopolymer transport system component
MEPKLKNRWPILLLLCWGCGDDDGLNPRRDSVPPGPVGDLVATRVSDDSVSLRWAAPGDDGFGGQASLYDVRYRADVPLTEEEWESATPVTTAPTPKAAGLKDEVGIGGLDRGRWFFALRAADEEQNWSSISNVSFADLGDVIPPSTVTDLTVFEIAETSISLTWTAPGDDGMTGSASLYDLRYSVQLITEDAWQDATEVEPSPEPSAPGTAEHFDVLGLETGQQYYFGIRTRDDAGNLAGLSNVVMATTSQDTIPPAAIVDLRVTFEGGRNVNLEWTAPGNDENRGRAAKYDLRYFDDTIDADTWNQATPVSDLPTPEVSGVTEAFVVSGLELDRNYHFALRAEDEAGNQSVISNDVAAMTKSLVIVTQSPGPPGVHAADWEPAGDRIVFTATPSNEERYQLYWVSSTGGSSTQLTEYPEGLTAFHVPRWSPNGSRLVCVFEHTQIPIAYFRIAVMDAQEGAEPIPITPQERGMRVQSPVWSPDGDRIAYVAGPFSIPLLGTLLVIDAAGGDPDTLLAEPAHFSGLSWSPDGSSIVFSSDLAGTYDLWSVAPMGGKPVLLFGSPASELQPTHSADGSRIGFTSDAGAQTDIWSVAATGGEPTQHTFTGTPKGTPSWSPAGDAIAFVLFTEKGGTGQVAIQYLP